MAKVLCLNHRIPIKAKWCLVQTGLLCVNKNIFFGAFQIKISFENSNLSGRVFAAFQFDRSEETIFLKGRELWSSGYGKRLMLRRSLFKFRRCILDGHFSHLFVVKLYCLFEKTTINEKEAGDGPFFKKKDCSGNDISIINTRLCCTFTETNEIFWVLIVPLVRPFGSATVRQFIGEQCDQMLK